MSKVIQDILQIQQDIFQLIGAAANIIYFLIFIGGQLMLIISLAWGALLIGFGFIYFGLQIVFDIPDIHLNEIWFRIPVGLFVLSWPLIIIGAFFHKVIEEGTIE